jgi:hypothetical protein
MISFSWTPTPINGAFGKVALREKHRRILIRFIMQTFLNKIPSLMQLGIQVTSGMRALRALGITGFQNNGLVCNKFSLAAS